MAEFQLGLAREVVVVVTVVFCCFSTKDCPRRRIVRRPTGSRFFHDDSVRKLAEK